MKSFIYSPSCLSMASLSVRREARRSNELKGVGFEEKFDATTIFYDICRVGEKIYLSGPPIFDAFKNVDVKWSLGSDEYGWCEVSPFLKDVKKCQDSYICIDKLPVENIQLEINGEKTLAAVNEMGIGLFSGRKVLLTKSKNNKLQWIRDWVLYHVVNHDIDSVLFYDNNSTDYDIQDIAGVFRGVGIDLAVVVRWPYKFGPQGGTRDGVKNAPWDSDFCQVWNT